MSMPDPDADPDAGDTPTGDVPLDPAGPVVTPVRTLAPGDRLTPGQLAQDDPA